VDARRRNGKGGLNGIESLTIRPEAPNGSRGIGGNDHGQPRRQQRPEAACFILPPDAPRWRRRDARPAGTRATAMTDSKELLQPDGSAPRVTTPRVTAAQVVDYLRRHPAFLMRHPELLDAQVAPGRDRGERVLDLQQFMVERLRREIGRLRTDQDELLANSRDNLSTQARIHKAVLALLAADSFERLIETVTTDLALLLDVDVVMLCIERSAGRIDHAAIDGIQMLAPGAVDRLLGKGQDVLLRDDVRGDEEAFGAAAGLVRSDALLRLRVSRATPAGLIAFGTRHPGYFNPGQGTELLGFLARVLEFNIRAWLDLAD
jgi:uncharacterized protein YigA (DUF484 family)